MDQTGYAIAQAKFYGYQADDKLLFKQASKQFYGGYNNPTKPSSKAYSKRGDNTENVSSNVLRNRRGSFTDAGTKILQSEAKATQPEVIPYSDLSQTVIKKPKISPTHIDYR